MLSGVLSGLVVGFSLVLVPTGAVIAQGKGQKPPYSPPVRENTTQLLWGDTHLHTTLSADAYTADVRVTPVQAYEFARGRTVTADNGMPVKLKRPLDFLVITDHSDYLGIYRRLAAGDPQLKDWPVGQRWAEYLKTGQTVKLGSEFAEAIQQGDPAYDAPSQMIASIWEDVTKRAERYNEPGIFSAIIGYEWTSMITGDNLHRVVLYKDGAEKANQMLPFTARESTDPQDLWQALASYEEKTGGDILAVAHNGNVSNGRMFSPTQVNGEPIDGKYAAERSRWEPVYEVTQVKGDGETHPYLSPGDEFADFETWDQGNIMLSQEKKPEMLQYEYARSALQEGLRHEANLGLNPFKFGMIGSTDSHTGFSTAEEDNFFGKFVESEPAPDRVTNKMAGQLQESWQLGASGLAAVWAPENTREAIFEAMERREVYATTGPRIKVRFFGGWEFDQQDIERADYARVGYDKGVPMGGDLTKTDDAAAPTFLIVAARDPDGANLDRVQVIKGWLDADGKTHEKIYDVALADGRRVDPETGDVQPVGNTVDLAKASYTNTIGDPELATVWRDPDFDPDQRAFYYVRVLQIPTPRWTAYDANYFDRDMPDRIPMVVQDRAYTSPIWYTP
jgi:hypothetical protein